MAAMATPRRSEFLDGIRAQLPLLLGVAPFGTAYGAYAIDSGVPADVTQAMSAVVFAGASQFVAVQLIATGVPGVMIVLAVLLVNVRHLLYSASLAPHLEHASAPWRWLLAYLLTDEAYATAIGRFERRTSTPYQHWFLFGSGVALWLTWQVTTSAGILLGTAVPESWSLDFALPLTFVALLVPVLTSRAALAAGAVAGIVATAGFDWPYALGLVSAMLVGLAGGLIAGRALGATRDGAAA